ncbi:MAG TPA: ATP-grasp domain-containing protein [Spirochaetota bacterium]|nr:ATP-grasp domain-containing protein [Spirochaetota bacterium]HOD15039.1 ATP-grasp domain-containing protein [Spirochaetota bacterium]HPG49398.1 ATP-grasp domain-containing protein [Spirochaetota bacterium]HPN12062.1 ATP-grasp domain-containing protein [Spirochaetota bacterium]
MFFRRKKAQQVNYFVSIGAGLNQIPLIREAKKLGLHVIGIDANSSAPGFYHCDLKIQESIENFDVIYKKLLELLVDGEIHGIMTKSYGTAIMTTSYLAEKFNIPFLPYVSSVGFINKRKMKSIFMEHDILTPHLIPMTSRTRLDKISPGSYPIVVKPNIGHAKVNVSLACNTAELQHFFTMHDRFADEFILEKFIRGDEIITAGIVHDSLFHLVEITDKKTSYPPYFIDLMHVSPSKYAHLFKRIEEIGQTVAESYGIRRSPLIMEFVINEDGEPFLIEAVPEFGGEFLPDVLIPASAQYNILEEAIKSATSRGFRPPQPRKNKNAVVVRYVTGQKGILASCNPDGPGQLKGTIFSRVLKDIGSPINDPVNNHDRVAVVAVTAPTVDEAIALSEQAVSNFNMRIK